MPRFIPSARALLVAGPLVATGALAAALIPPAAAASVNPAATNQIQLVDRARLAINDARQDKEFGNAAQLARHARAILIVPRLFKAGFFIGGEGGDGVMVARTPGGWSAPAFYTLASASFGLQIGAQESELILFIMSDRALRAVMNNEFKLGANAAISVVTLGSSAEAATTSAMKADIVAWASSTGAYAGITVNGSVIRPDQQANRDFYGSDVTPGGILTGGDVGNASADALEAAVAALG
jgi:lipid-binding SYLF domain-containing protein